MLPQVELTRKWSTETVRMYMMPGEEEALLTLVDWVQPKSMLEIGVNEGRTAAAVLEFIPTIERYVGVDAPSGYEFEIPEQGNEQPAAPAHMVAEDPRFELVLRGDDSRIVGPFDVVFIDGDHGYNWVRRDYKLARRVVRSGGIIIFHDYGNRTVKVTEALNLFHEEGRQLSHVAGTWLAYERVA